MIFYSRSIAYLAPEMLEQKGHGRAVDWYLLGVLLYELIVGLPPYFSKNRDELFKNIKSGPLLMPRNISEEAKSLIRMVELPFFFYFSTNNFIILFK